MVPRFRKTAAWSIGAGIHILKTVFLMERGCCRYTPSCTEYAKEAVEKFSLGTAIVLIVKRVVRCHPFASGGFDPVPDDVSMRKG